MSDETDGPNSATPKDEAPEGAAPGGAAPAGAVPGGDAPPETPRDPWAPPADEPSDRRGNRKAKAESAPPPAPVQLTKNGPQGEQPPLPFPPPAPGCPAPARGGDDQLPSSTGYQAYQPYPGYPSYPGYPGLPGGPGHPGHPGYPMGPYGAWGSGVAPRNGLGVTALVLGIVGTVLGVACFGAFLGVPVGIAALIFGIAGVRKANRGEASNRGQAMAGLILGVVATVVSLAMIALVVVGSIMGHWFDQHQDNFISADNGDIGSPLSAGGTATYDDGVKVTVSGIRWADNAPAKYLGGSAVRFTVTVENTGDTTADLSGDELTAYEDETDDDPLRDLSSADDLPSRLAAGGRASTEVIVVVPSDTDKHMDVEVAPGYEYDYTYWSVALPKGGRAARPTTGAGTGTGAAA